LSKNRPAERESSSFDLEERTADPAEIEEAVIVKRSDSIFSLQSSSQLQTEDLSEDDEEQA